MSDEIKQDRDEMSESRIIANMRQIKWVAAFNKNPELGLAMLSVFDMDEEDIQLILRVINALKDGLRFYKDDIRKNDSKRRTNKKSSSGSPSMTGLI